VEGVGVDGREAAILRVRLRVERLAELRADLMRRDAATVAELRRAVVEADAVGAYATRSELADAARIARPTMYEWLGMVRRRRSS
jgi:hypothetical protein